MGRAVNEEGLMRKQWLAAGLGIWLCFSCLLRPGELRNPRRCDISFPDGELGEEELQLGAVVIIRRPKTRRIWKEQFVLCRDVKLVKWLRWWLEDVSGGRLVFPLVVMFGCNVSTKRYPSWVWWSVVTRWAL